MHALNLQHKLDGEFMNEKLQKAADAFYQNPQPSSSGVNHQVQGFQNYSSGPSSAFECIPKRLEAKHNPRKEQENPSFFIGGPLFGHQPGPNKGGN